jgi:murein tripeptide amidase MpaA
MNIRRWWSLNPVYSYTNDLADPSHFAPTKEPVNQIVAWNGPSLPQRATAHWNYIPTAWTSADAFSFVQSFDQNDVHIAMRTPYTAEHQEMSLATLKEMPGVQLLTAGTSPGGVPLRIVLVTEPSPDEEALRRKPCVLIYAREHANEQDSSWVVDGAIRFLVSGTPQANEARLRANFLLIPLLDPDGAQSGAYERITGKFVDSQLSPPEARSYIQFFRTWMKSGRRLDVVINLHNVESSESPHLICAQMEDDNGRLRDCVAFHNVILNEVVGSQFYVRAVAYRTGYTPTRLSGWLAREYGALAMPYEANVQQAVRHLTLDETRELGRILVSASAKYVAR